MSNNQHEFAAKLLAWHAVHGRHDLPWQENTDPYRVWLSEIMLQQTQVATVIPYYRRFLQRFPDLASLATASQAEVMPLWSGLGYYARARNLHRCAERLVSEFASQFPHDPQQLADLPGIGRSTANAIADFCFGAREPILDGNVKRVLCRCFGIEGFPGNSAVEKELWQLAADLLPEKQVDDYIQAQMDLGASLCSRSKPDCGHCPLNDICIATKTGRTAELPAKKPAKKLVEKTAKLLMLLHQHVDGVKILLQRRPPNGIWGGLLSLPEIASDETLAAFLQQHGLHALSMPRALEPLRHSFTHFHLRIEAQSIRVQKQPSVQDEAGWEWLRLDDLATAALPAPIRQLLNSLAASPSAAENAQ